MIHYNLQRGLKLAGLACVISALILLFITLTYLSDAREVYANYVGYSNGVTEGRAEGAQLMSARISTAIASSLDGQRDPGTGGNFQLNFVFKGKTRLTLTKNYCHVWKK